MKSRPILYKAQLVRSIRNTKPGIFPGEPIDPKEPAKWMTRRRVMVRSNSDLSSPKLRPARHLNEVPDVSPFGVAGDQLWCRETWAATSRSLDNVKPSKLAGDTEIAYQADGQDTGYLLWRPSIHMPRVFARVFQEVVAVRAERVRDITAADVVAEGIITEDQRRRIGDDRAIEFFRMAWDRVYGRASWPQNPVVWVISTKTIAPSGALSAPLSDATPAAL